MLLDELTPTATNDTVSAIGDGPVTMVNLLWFRDAPDYDPGFADPKPDVHSAYYEGYAGAFVAVEKELGVEGVEIVLVASRKDGLVAGPDDDCDDIVIVRYPDFANFRRIVDSEQYRRKADPHRVAAIANWRLIATVSQ